MLTTAGPPPSPPLLLFILLLITTPPPSNSLSFSQFQTLFSLSHSLMTRVANLRASRGDLSGSDRARLIAAKLKRATGLGFWGAMWSVGWDYVRNYSWRDFTALFEVRGAVSDLNELLRALNELTRMESQAERVEWVSRNYKNALRVSISLFQRLLQVFSQSRERYLTDRPLKNSLNCIGKNNLKPYHGGKKRHGNRRVSITSCLVEGFGKRFGKIKEKGDEQKKKKKRRNRERRERGEREVEKSKVGPLEARKSRAT